MIEVFGIAFSIMGLLPSIASTLAYSVPAGPVGMVWVRGQASVLRIAGIDEAIGVVSGVGIHLRCWTGHGRLYLHKYSISSDHLFMATRPTWAPLCPHLEDCIGGHTTLHQPRPVILFVFLSAIVILWAWWADCARSIVRAPSSGSPVARGCGLIACYRCLRSHAPFCGCRCS